MKHTFEINEDGTITYNGNIYARVSEQLDVQPEVPIKEQTFASLVKDLERKEDMGKYPYSTFWFSKDGVWMFEYNKQTDYFWCSYPKVWSVFESKFGMKYYEVQDFIRSMLEKHFKLKGVTPTDFVKESALELEKHFKLKGVTPLTC